MAFTSQVVERAGLTGDDGVKLHAQNREHRKQLARTEFRRAPAFEARQRFRRNAGLPSHCRLPQPETATARDDSFTEFLEGLHLILTSRNCQFLAILDLIIKFCKTDRPRRQPGPPPGPLGGSVGHTLPR